MSALTTFLTHLTAKSYRTLFFILLVIILGVSSIPSLPEPAIKGIHLEIRLDYLFHLGQYFLLAWLGISWVHKKSPGLLSIKVWMVIILLIIGTGDEFHQMLIPGRTFNPTDNLFNLIGVICGSVACFYFWRWAEKQGEKQHNV